MHGSAGEETLPGDAREDGAIECLEFIEMCEERKVFVAEFAEAETWIKEDFCAGGTGGMGGGEALAQTADDGGLRPLLLLSFCW